MGQAATENKVIDAKNKLIVALDVETAKEARDIVLELRDTVGAFKIGLQLLMAAGPALVKELTSQGIKVFLDTKFHDIPNTVAKASLEVARMGVWLFNIHAMGGGEMMRRTNEEVSELCDRHNLRKPKIIAVTVLTSADKSVLHEIGIWNEPGKQVINLAKLAQASGLDGVVASAREAAEVRNSTGSEFMIVTPGIRPANSETNDQKRVMTPREAINAGADYLVVGRPITAAQDMLTAAHKVIAEMG